MLAAFFFHWTQRGFNSLISIRTMFSTFGCPKDIVVQSPALDLQAELHRCYQPFLSHHLAGNRNFSPNKWWWPETRLIFGASWEQPCRGGSWRLLIFGMITTSFNEGDGFGLQGLCLRERVWSGAAPQPWVCHAGWKGVRRMVFVPLPSPSLLLFEKPSCKNLLPAECRKDCLEFGFRKWFNFFFFFFLSSLLHVIKK